MECSFCLTFQIQVAFDSVDSPTFKCMTNALGHRFDSRNTIGTLLDPMFSFAFSERVAVAQAADAISFGADLWTGVNKTKYLALTGHWMDERWTLQHALFGFMAIYGSTSAALLHAMISERTNRVAAEDQLIATLVTDGGADVVAARGLNGADGTPCANHLLNLAINDVMHGDGTFMHDIRAVEYAVNLVQAHKNLANKFASVQTEMDGSALVLLGKNATRWSSQYAMLERFLSLKDTFLSKSMEDAVEHMRLEIPEGVAADMLTKPFFRRLKGLVHALKAADVMTVALQSLEKPTASRVPFLLHRMTGLWERMLDDDSISPVVREFITVLKDSVNTRMSALLSPSSCNIIMAALVDPTQARFLEQYGVPHHVITEAWDWITKEVADRLSGDKVVQLAGIDVNEHAKSQVGILRGLMNNSSIGPDDDPLLFYRSTNLSLIQGTVPTIKMLLAMPASECHCERVFSWSNGILTKKRNRFGASTLEQVMILYDALKGLDEKQCEEFLEKFKAFMEKAHEEEEKKLY